MKQKKMCTHKINQNFQPPHQFYAMQSKVISFASLVPADGVLENVINTFHFLLPTRILGRVSQNPNEFFCLIQSSTFRKSCYYFPLHHINRLPSFSRYECEQHRVVLNSCLILYGIRGATADSRFWSAVINSVSVLTFILIYSNTYEH